MEVSLIWWNTSLSPSAKQNRSNDDEKEAAFSLINIFLETMKIDILCLGEISSSDVQLIRKHCNLEGYSLHDGVEAVGRTNFDTCIIYRQEKLFLANYKNISSLKGASTLKVAQRLDFIVSEFNELLYVFVSHWPSRLWCEEHHADRHYLGVRLRDAVEEIFEYSPQHNVILLGDYNDEPFAQSLSDQLMATRDRELVSKRKELLYNPFWRHMGSDKAYTYEANETVNGGSYYYRGDSRNRWRTFDQIIFSSSFLGDSKWHLKESATQILNLVPYTSLVHSNNEKFDHLPVMSVVERVS